MGARSAGCPIAEAFPAEPETEGAGFCSLAKKPCVALKNTFGLFFSASLRSAALTASASCSHAWDDFPQKDLLPFSYNNVAFSSISYCHIDINTFLCNHSVHIRTRLKRPINGAFRLSLIHI